MSFEKCEDGTPITRKPKLLTNGSAPFLQRLVIVTKVGARRGEDKSWLRALSRQELIDAVHDNLRNLGLDKLDVVNLRVESWSHRKDPLKNR